MKVKTGREWGPNSPRPPDAFHVSILDPIEHILGGSLVETFQSAGQQTEPPMGHGMDYRTRSQRPLTSVVE